MVHDSPFERDYAQAYATFDLDEAARTLSGSMSEGINACVECIDRYADTGRIAFYWEGQDGRSAQYTFAQLQKLSAQFANLLKAHGIGPGDVIAGLLPRTPDLLITILGTWRAGAIYQPLFTAFGPKAIEHRLRTSGAKFVVSDKANRGKLDEVEGLTFKIAQVSQGGEPVRAGDIDFTTELAAQSETFAPVLRGGSDLFMMMSTSGTTGLPKGVPVPLSALLSFAAYMRESVDLRPDDVFWNIADPGWAYGLYYAVTGPLLLGNATLFYDGSFMVRDTYRVIKKYGVTNLAGSPTAFRMMIAAGPEEAAIIKGQLRRVSSAGEPLNPEVIRWFAEHLDAPIYDHYGQTELGMVVCNHHRLKHTVHQGSAGVPLPGYRVAILDENHKEQPPHAPGVLAVDIARSPLLWFSGYLNQPTPAITNGYYLTGDVMEMADDGSVAFVGRSDDVITSSGYRIGPFDVESALIEHPAVVEAAVVGKPDPDRTEIVKAFVVLSGKHQPSAALAEELRQYVRKRLSAHSYPREIDFVAELPKTPSGKLQRFILRNQEIAKAKEQQST